MAYGTAAPQLGATPGEACAVQNYGSVTLPSGALVVLDTTNQLGGATPGATYFESMSLGAILPPVAAHAIGSLGWLPAPIPPGQRGECRLRGLVPVVAAGSITAGGLLSICSTSGRLGRAQAAASGDEAMAQALTAASDGDIFMARLFGAIVPVP